MHLQHFFGKSRVGDFCWRMGFLFNSCTSEDFVIEPSKGRLKREDCEFVKHDKLFSNWKVINITLALPSSS